MYNSYLIVGLIINNNNSFTICNSTHCLYCAVEFRRIKLNRPKLILMREFRVVSNLVCVFISAGSIDIRQCHTTEHSLVVAVTKCRKW